MNSIQGTVTGRWSSNGKVDRVRHINPGRSPYKPRSRYLHEMSAYTSLNRYCIADRNDIPVLLFTTYAEAQTVCEHININMAKEVLS